MKPWDKVFRDCFTGIDNRTYDLGRISYAFAHFILFGLVVFLCSIGRPPSLMDLASSESAITVAFAIHLGIKKDTEPGRKEDIKLL